MAKKKLTAVEKFKRRVAREVEKRLMARSAEQLRRAMEQQERERQKREKDEAERARLAALPLSDVDRLKRVPEREAWRGYAVQDADVAATLRRLAVSRYVALTETLADDEMIKSPQHVVVTITGKIDAGVLAEYTQRAAQREREAVWAIVKDHLTELAVPPELQHLVWKRLVEHRGSFPE